MVCRVNTRQTIFTKFSKVRRKELDDAVAQSSPFGAGVNIVQSHPPSIFDKAVQPRGQS